MKENLYLWNIKCEIMQQVFLKLSIKCVLHLGLI